MKAKYLGLLAVTAVVCAAGGFATLFPETVFRNLEEPPAFPTTDLPPRVETPATDERRPSDAPAFRRQTETPGAAFRLMALPIRCTPGTDCWVINYVDLDPTEGARDYHCGFMTYDGHKGTDFALPHLQAMNDGVEVLAAAAGTVVGTRDGMDDITFRRDNGAAYVRKRECGNGVGIRHDDGWFTQYCHMRRGSLRVSEGDRVEAGQTLGLVGHSGLAEFPHVHLQVMKDDAIIDPFVGEGERTNACAVGPDPLWADDVLPRLAYPGAVLYNAGFAARPPKPEAVREGLYRDAVLSRRSPLLFLWVDMFGVLAGDELIFTVTGPDGGTVLEYANSLTKTQIRRFAFAGQRRSGLFWEPGTYRGVIRLVRAAAASPPREWTVVREVELR